MGYLLFLVASIFLDSNVFSVPLVFVASFLVVRSSFVKYEKGRKKTPAYTSHKTLSLDALIPLIMSVIALFLIDVIRMQRLGISPVLFLFSVTLLIAYGRFFEISKSRFFAGILVVMTFIYSYITGYDLVATGIFLFLIIVTKWILALITHEEE